MLVTEQEVESQPASFHLRFIAGTERSILRPLWLGAVACHPKSFLLRHYLLPVWLIRAMDRVSPRNGNYKRKLQSECHGPSAKPLLGNALPGGPAQPVASRAMYCMVFAIGRAGRHGLHVYLAWVNCLH